MKSNTMNKKKMVIFFPETHSSLVGWADKFSRIQYLSRSFDVMIVGKSNRFFKKENIAVHEIPYDRLSLQCLYFIMFTYLYLIPKKYRILFIPDVTYFPVVLFFPTIFTVGYGGINPYQFISTPENMNVQSRIWVELFFITIPFFKLIFPVSVKLKELFTRKFKNPNLIQLDHGVDLTIFKNEDLKKEQDPIRLIYTGTLNKERGLTEIIQAFYLVRESKKDVELVLVGLDDEAKNEVKNVDLEKYQLNKGSLIMVCSVSRDEVNTYLNKADIALSYLSNITMFTTNPPQKIFEYMACQLPIIANDNPIHTYYLKHRENAIITEDHFRSIADAMLLLINDDDLRRKISENNIKATKQYDQKQIFEKMVIEINHGIETS